MSLGWKKEKMKKRVFIFHVPLGKLLVSKIWAREFIFSEVQWIKSVNFISYDPVFFLWFSIVIKTNPRITMSLLSDNHYFILLRLLCFKMSEDRFWWPRVWLNETVLWEIRRVCIIPHFCSQTKITFLTVF